MQQGISTFQIMHCFLAVLVFQRRKSVKSEWNSKSSFGFLILVKSPWNLLKVRGEQKIWTQSPNKIFLKKCCFLFLCWSVRQGPALHRLLNTLHTTRVCKFSLWACLRWSWQGLIIARPLVKPPQEIRAARWSSMHGYINPSFSAAWIYVCTVHFLMETSRNCN